MRRFTAAVGAGIVSLAAWGCGGGSATSGNPGAPSPPAGAVTINVVAIRGSQSFSPNPSTVPAGQMVVWHNIDTVTHRVVLNDGELDTGNLQPGGFSEAMFLVAPGPYHCTLHPEMVGTVSR